MTTVALTGGAGDSAREGRVVRAAARDLGLRASTLGQYIRTRGIHRQVATIIRRAIEHGDHTLASRLFAPIAHAYAARQLAPFGPALIRAQQAADLAEDLAEAQWNADPSDDNLRTWLEKLRIQRGAADDLALAMEAELAR